MRIAILSDDPRTWRALLDTTADTVELARVTADACPLTYKPLEGPRSAGRACEVPAQAIACHPEADR